MSKQRAEFVCFHTLPVQIGWRKEPHSICLWYVHHGQWDGDFDDLLVETLRVDELTPREALEYAQNYIECESKAGRWAHLGAILTNGKIVSLANLSIDGNNEVHITFEDELLFPEDVDALYETFEDRGDPVKELRSLREALAVGLFTFHRVIFYNGSKGRVLCEFRLGTSTVLAEAWGDGFEDAFVKCTQKFKSTHHITVAQ